MPKSGLFERKINTTTLSNGIRVITEAMPQVRSVSVGVWLADGARSEKAEQSGISHFIEHMVFQGTENRSAQAIARGIDSIGGNLDAFTAKELVSFNTKVLDENLPAAFDILSDLVLRPLFREQDIEKEKGVVLEELKMETDSPEYLVHELFSGKFWNGHSLGLPILGKRKTIRSFDRAMIRKYFRQTYVPSSIVVTAAGNLRHARMLKLVEQQFGGLKPRRAAGPGPAPKATPHVYLKSKRALQQVQLCLGVPAYPINHERRYACYILNTLLGGGMSSRLFQIIREQRGLAYSVFSELSLYRDAGCLLVSAGTSLRSAPEVVRLSLAEFRRFKEEPLSAEELSLAKNQLKGSLMLSLESTASRMANLARQELYFGRHYSLDEMLASIDQVTAEHVQEVACDLFRPDRVSLTVLGELNGMRISRSDLEC